MNSQKLTKELHKGPRKKDVPKARPKDQRTNINDQGKHITKGQTIKAGHIFDLCSLVIVPNRPFFINFTKNLDFE